MRKKDGGFRLPNPAIVSGRTCVTLDIPDDIVHRANFWGTLHSLARASNYDSARLSDSYAVAEMWREIIENARIAECGGSMDCQDVLDCLDGVPAWEQLNAPPSEIGMSPAEIQALSDEQHTARDTQYNGTPQSIMDDATNDNVNEWLLNAAIEDAVTAWVVACFEAKLNQIRQIEGLAIIANLLLSFASYLGGGGWLIKGWGWSFLAGTMYASYNYSNLWDALQDEENLRYTVGAILSSMANGNVKTISFTNYQNLAEYGDGNRWAYGDVPLIRNWLRDEILQHPLTAEKNYLLLLQAIHTANYHKLYHGDPMWRAWLNNYEMYRGKNYSPVGVNMINGTISRANGFNYDMTSQYGYLTYTLNTSPAAKIDYFRMQLRSGTPASRYSNMTVRNDGATVLTRAGNWTHTSDTFGNLGHVEFTSVTYDARLNWGANNAPASYDNNGHLLIRGNHKPPVGYWTPD